MKFAVKTLFEQKVLPSTSTTVFTSLLSTCTCMLYYDKEIKIGVYTLYLVHNIKTYRARDLVCLDELLSYTLDKKTVTDN